MSEGIKESVPTSEDPRSKRPANRRLVPPHLRPISDQAAQINNLFKDPSKTAPLPPRPKKTTAASLPPPPEVVANVQGSSAGAGSGEFHVYKAARRREYERLRLMTEEKKVEEEAGDFERKRKENAEKDEEKTNKKRQRREKKKVAKQKKEQNKEQTGPADTKPNNDATTDEKTGENEKAVVTEQEADNTKDADAAGPADAGEGLIIHDEE